MAPGGNGGYQLVTLGWRFYFPTNVAGVTRTQGINSGITSFDTTVKFIANTPPNPPRKAIGFKAKDEE
jgi:hypothetical protein